MAKVTPMPAEGAKLVERLENATARMAGLEDEVDSLRLRMGNADVSAIHLGLRHIAEALLRHALREEGEEPKTGHGGTLDVLKQSLMARVKVKSHESKQVEEMFWRNIDEVQRRVNPNTHFQKNDVYRASSLRRRDPWDEILSALRALVCVAEEFRHWWPPPHGVTAAVHSTPGEPGPDELDGAEDRESPAGEDEGHEDGGDPAAIADLTVAQVRGSEAVRSWLVRHSNLQARGVSRRLNAAHGATKLYNLFPDAFGTDAQQLSEDQTESERALDYETIGNLTIKEARELELVDEIATLSGLAPATVRKKLQTLHGGGVVRRQFDWYAPEVLGGLTAHMALRYGLSSFLARALGKQRTGVMRKLTGSPGQTKLRTLFPELA